MVRGRGRGRGRGRRGGVTIPHFHDRLGALGAKALNFKDTSPPSFPFSPPRPVGVHLPAGVNADDPESLFKLFFDHSIVQSICNASNE